MTYVTREELSAHIEPMQEDIREIKSDVKSLLNGKYDNAYFGGKGNAVILTLVSTVVSGLVAAFIALLFG